jgi:hypothetical protein
MPLDFRRRVTNEELVQLPSGKLVWKTLRSLWVRGPMG